MRTSRFPLLILVALSLGLLSSLPIQASSLSICTGANTEGLRVLESPYLEGLQIQLVVSDEEGKRQGCESLQLPVDTNSIQWASVTNSLSVTSLSQIGLQGDFGRERASISEIINFGTTPTTPIYLPFQEDIADFFNATTFGEEGGARLEGNTLICAAGGKVAGAFLKTDAIWQRGSNLSLALTALGDGNFQLGVSDRARELAESPLILGNLVLSETSRSQFFEFDLPNQINNWTSLTLTCPPQGGELKFSGVFLNPGNSRYLSPRSAWFWAPALWLENPEVLWSTARLQNIAEIFITVPTTPQGAVLNPEELTDFVRNSRQRGLVVWAVIGDRNDVLPNNLPTLLTRVSAYKSYNESALPDSKLAGLQLDIEPYLLPGFVLNQDYWRERYVVTISQVNSAVNDSMPLDLVMPVWWGTHPNWGEQLFAELPLKDISVTVMDYRTVLARIRNGAIPFLDWGQRNNVPIRIALETGPLGDEVLRRYVKSEDEGELWAVQIGGHQVLLLLDEKIEGVPGGAFNYVSESIINASNLTFGGNMVQMEAVMDVLEAEWSSWSSFAGIAVHGLENVFINEVD